MSKLLAILLFPLCCYAQVGVEMPILYRQSSSSLFQPTNLPNLFVYLTTDDHTSLSNLANGTTVITWTNIAPISPTVGFTSFGQPISFLIPGPSPAIGAVDFACTTCTGGGGFANVKMLQSSLRFDTNQPVTWYFVANCTNDYDHALSSGNKFGCFTDSTLGGRQLCDDDPSVLTLGLFAGSSVSSANTTFVSTNHWIVFSYVVNGVSSIIYTNGVQIASGDAGTQGIGNVIMGTENTGTTQLMAKIACVLAYGAAHNVTQINQVVTGLRSRFGI